MKIHEYQAKNLFAQYGIPIQAQKICETTEQAVDAYKSLGCQKVVIKAQVHTGGRGKAGGIKLASSEKEVQNCAGQILGMNIKSFIVEKILLSQAVSIREEYYMSFTIGRNTKSVILIISKEGGIDIETAAAETPEKILRFSIDPFIGIPDYLARKFAFELFPDFAKVKQFAPILQKTYKLFIDTDASLVEINPLAVDKEDIITAVDAKITFDDNALFRHADLQELAEPTEEEKIEAYAKEKGFSFIPLNGNIGCMVNGAGLAMATMDLITLYGGKPANFLDIGGSSNPQKVIDAMELLLKDKQVKSVMINIFGGITRCDDVSLGLLKAFEQIRTNIPVVVRLTGTNEKKGRKLLENSRFQLAESMSEATKLAIKAAN